MLLETHHRERYLQLRCIAPPCRFTAISVVMVDRHGDAVKVQLYQQPDESECPAKRVVDDGTILLIKEPYFKVLSDGSYGVRVDHISDVVHVDATSADVPASWRKPAVQLLARERKAKGNECIKRIDNWGAIEAYGTSPKFSSICSRL